MSQVELLDPAGLTGAQAADRRRTDGPNALPRPRPPSPLMLLLRQLTNFFAIMLWIAAALAFVGGTPELGVAIAVVVLVNGLFAFAQEYRADRAGQRLQDLLPVRATVLRDGRRTEIAAADLVCGDLVLPAGPSGCSARSRRPSSSERSSPCSPRADGTGVRTRPWG